MHLAQFTASALLGAVGATAWGNSTTSNSSSWQLTETWSGPDFFDNWDFWVEQDPGNTMTYYVDRETAEELDMISVDWQGHAYMRVDTTKHVDINKKRNAYRIDGHLNFTGGLILMDAYHMPTGCGIWPAWWTVGPDWPTHGEIDIIENIHMATYNDMTIHMEQHGDGCGLPDDTNATQKAYFDPSGLGRTPNGEYWACYPGGCGSSDETVNNTFGAGYNSIGGGVNALLWTNQSIQIWFFPRDSIPQDIYDEQPVPESWGLPDVNYTSPDCVPSEYFHDHFAVFQTCYCGIWAGDPTTWNVTYGGASDSCMNVTGYATCEDYIRHEGNKLVDAYWEVGYVKYFNQTGFSAYTY